LLAALAVQLGGTVLGVARMGEVFTSSDEYCRLVYAIQWTRDPYFATWDHIWLGGNFWILGSMLALGGSPVVVGIVHGAVCGLLAAGLGYALLRALGAGRWVALAGVVCFATRPIVMALSKSSQPDMLFIAMLYGAMLAVAYHVSRGDSARPSWAWAWGTAAVVVAGTLRYEGWFLAVPWGLAALAFFAISIRRAMWRDVIAWGAMGLALAVFPLLWMWSSHSRLGSAFAFMENMRPMIASDAVESVANRVRNRMSFYPRQTWAQTPTLVIPGLVGVVAALMAPGRGARAAGGLLAAFWAVVIASTAWMGLGNNWPFRLAIPFIAPVALLAPLGIALLARWIPRPAVIAVAVVVAGLDARHTAGNFDELLISNPPSRDMVRLGNYLRYRAEPIGQLEILALDARGIPGFWGYEDWVLASHAGTKIDLRPVVDDGLWEVAKVAHNVRFIVTKKETETPLHGEIRSRGSFSLRERDPVAP